MAEHETAVYYSLIESMIADQRQIWGKQAVEIADSVPGLHLSDQVSTAEDIWVTGDGRAVAGLLAEAYVDRFGQAAASSLAEVADEYRDDATLPSALQD